MTHLNDWHTHQPKEGAALLIVLRCDTNGPLAVLLYVCIAPRLHSVCLCSQDSEGSGATGIKGGLALCLLSVETEDS